jgi:hypothetical protein
MTSEVREIIDLLEHVRLRPGMFMGSDDPETFIVFLSGLMAGCRIFSIKVGDSTSDEFYEKTILERGWNLESSTYAPRQQMRDRGMTSTEILDELIQIQIDVLVRRYQVKRTEE